MSVTVSFGFNRTSSDTVLPFLTCLEIPGSRNVSMTDGFTILVVTESDVANRTTGGAILGLASGLVKSPTFG